MKKRLLKTAVATALTVAFAVPVFAAPAASANPFSDVPAKHWAYDAVNKLVQAGIVDGYGDGTFRGDKTMTRYEMAQIVAKAMSKNLNADQKAVTDKLAKEFGTELNNLGVKVAGLENKIDNMVKISGDARVRYMDDETAGSNSDYRARVTFDAKISDNLKFNARLTSGDMSWDGNGNIALDTANVSFKAFGLDNTVGRQAINLGDGFLYDTKINGVTTTIGGVKLAYGKKDADENILGAEFGFNAMGAKVKASFFQNDKEGAADQEIYGAKATFGLASNVEGIASYYKNNDNDDSAAAYGVKFNKLGLSAMYRDVEAGAYTGAGTEAYDAVALNAADGFKGMEYQLDKKLDKNTVLSVKHQDFKNQAGTELGARTSAAVNVKF